MELDNMTDSLATWLNQHFLDWERQEGKRRTITAFAQYLGVPQSSLSSWMSGAYMPSGESIQKIAEKLGYEIYDILGVQRPPLADERLAYIASIWDDLDEEARQKLLREAREMIVHKRNDPGAGGS